MMSPRPGVEAPCRGFDEEIVAGDKGLLHRTGSHDVGRERVVAGPGDRLHIRNKQLFRNGELVSEPDAILSSSSMDSYGDNFPLRLRSGPISAAKSCCNIMSPTKS